MSRIILFVWCVFYRQCCVTTESKYRILGVFCTTIYHMSNVYFVLREAHLVRLYFFASQYILLILTCFAFVLHLIPALWATQYTENTEKDSELKVKTTLRELIVYLVFLIIVCIGRSHSYRHISHATRVEAVSNVAQSLHKACMYIKF